MTETCFPRPYLVMSAMATAVPMFANWQEDPQSVQSKHVLSEAGTYQAKDTHVVVDPELLDEHGARPHAQPNHHGRPHKEKDEHSKDSSRSVLVCVGGQRRR